VPEILDHTIKELGRGLLGFDIHRDAVVNPGVVGNFYLIVRCVRPSFTARAGHRAGKHAI
jgi:hypothetical protein